MMKGCLYRHEGLYQSDGERSAAFRDSPLFQSGGGDGGCDFAGSRRTGFSDALEYPGRSNLYIGEGADNLYCERGIDGATAGDFAVFAAKVSFEYDPATQILVTVGGSEAIDLALRSSWSRGMRC